VVRPRPRGQRVKKAPSCSHVMLIRRSLPTLPAGTRAHHLIGSIIPSIQMKTDLD
jgi:hypothetical protein